MTNDESKVVARYLGKPGTIPDFGPITDPRDRRGLRWELPTVLNALFVGMAAMCRSMLEIEELTAGLGPCRRRLGIERRLPDSTAGDIIEALDAGEFAPLLRDQVRGANRAKSLQERELPIGLLAVDGKNVATLDFEANEFCQKQPESGGAPHWTLHALRAVLVSSPAKPCIGQRFIHGKTNEIATLKPFVEALLRDYGRSELFECISGDAGFTSKANAAFLDQRQLGYVLALKDNQPELYREARGHLGEGLATYGEPEVRTDWEPIGGKRIRRELWRTAELAAWDGWPSLRQVWRVRQTTRKTGQEDAIQDRYFIVNLPWGRLNGWQSLSVVRAHWGIENNCFHTLDTQWKEDRRHGFRRSGSALMVLAWIRLLAYNAVQLLRTRYLRSPRNRSQSWAVLRDWLKEALRTVAAAEWRISPEHDVVAAMEHALAAA